MFVLKCKECKKESKFANIESVKTVEKVFYGRQLQYFAACPHCGIKNRLDKRSTNS